MVLPLADLLKRITIDADRMHGRPCVRGLRVTVADILGLMSAGQSREAILQEYPYLEDADIDAVLAFAARQADHPIRGGIGFVLSDRCAASAFAG